MSDERLFFKAPDMIINAEHIVMVECTGDATTRLYLSNGSTVEMNDKFDDICNALITWKGHVKIEEKPL